MRIAQAKISRNGASRPRPTSTTLDAIAATPPQRFSIAIGGSLFVHAVIFALWLSSSLISKPEILEIREISYLDESELPPEEKAPEIEPEVKPGEVDAFDNREAESSREAIREIAQGAPNASSTPTTPSTPSSESIGNPFANGIPAGAGEPGPPAPNVEDFGVLKVMDGVADVASVGEAVLNIPGAGKFLSNGKVSNNGADISASVMDGFLGGTGDGNGYGNGVDGIYEGLKGEIGGTGVKLGKVGRVTIERIGRVTGNREATTGGGGRSEESLRQVMIENMGRLQYIYTKFLKNGMQSHGKVEVEVTIAADGSVEAALVLSSEISVTAFQNEIIDAVRRWKYRPIARGYMKVVYPMVFVEMN